MSGCLMSRVAKETTETSSNTNNIQYIYEKALKTMKSKGNSYWKSQFIFRDRIAYFHKWQLGILVRLLKYLLLWIIMVGTYQTTFSYWSHSASNSMYLYYDVCELWSSSNVSWKNRRHRIVALRGSSSWQRLICHSLLRAKVSSS